MKVPISTCCINSEPVKLKEIMMQEELYKSASKSERLQYNIARREKMLSSLKGRKLTKKEKDRIKKAEKNWIDNEYAKNRRRVLKNSLFLFDITKHLCYNLLYIMKYNRYLFNNICLYVHYKF